jgi:hypothetical protein
MGRYGWMYTQWNSVMCVVLLKRLKLVRYYLINKTFQAIWHKNDVKSIDHGVSDACAVSIHASESVSFAVRVQLIDVTECQLCGH